MRLKITDISKSWKLYFLLLLIGALQSIGQQRVHFTQYMVNQYVLNPAAGGIGADLDVNVGYRKQWVNFKGGPETYYFSGHMPIRESRKPKKGAIDVPHPFQSAGVFVFKDKTGPISKTSVLLSYGYNLPLSKGFRLALGVYGGFMQLQLDNNLLKFDQQGEVTNYQTRTMPDGSAGLWLYNNYFYFGSSANQLFYNSVDFYKNDNTTNSSAGSSNLVYHYYATTGVKIPLSHPTAVKDMFDWYIVPSTMIKYGGWGTPISIDLNTKLKYKDHFWIGTSYRHRDAIAFLAGVRFHTKDIGAFELGYSYDYTLTKIMNYTSGSHEIILGYTHKMKKSIICPDKFW